MVSLSSTLVYLQFLIFKFLIFMFWSSSFWSSSFWSSSFWSSRFWSSSFWSSRFWSSRFWSSRFWSSRFWSSVQFEVHILVGSNYIHIKRSSHLLVCVWITWFATSPNLTDSFVLFFQLLGMLCSCILMCRSQEVRYEILGGPNSGLRV